ncbi:MAG TPA: hypothetical protein VI728_01500 [Syntrophales bacterium]|nr:hypothetical protein [Syntrophales bacterium]
MKKGFFSILFVLLLATPCLAFQNEPDGFRGIKWGEDISGRDDMAPHSAGADKTISYTRKGDEAFLGGVMLDSLTYDYWDGKFSGVFMLFRDADRFEKIKAICFEKFGKMKKHARYPESYVWEGKKAVVYFEYDSIRNSGSLSISSVRFLEKKKSFDKTKAKEAAEKGF